MPSPTAPLLGAQTPPPAPSRPGTDYADLMRRVKQAGLLDRWPGYYLTKIAITAALLAAGWTAFALLGDTWWQLVVAGFLALVFAQIGGPLVDFALGALNYQIEHHLFPSMPRPNLRRSQPLTRAFCRQRGLPYCETTLLRSYAQALQHLHEVGRPLRVAPAGELP
jgi:Fatty acid desaturase